MSGPAEYFVKIVLMLCLTPTTCCAKVEETTSITCCDKIVLAPITCAFVELNSTCFVKGDEVCHDEEKTIVSQKPIETCNIEPVR